MAETADTQRLIALVEANTKQFERALDRLTGVTRRSMQNVEKEVNRVNAALTSAGAAMSSFVRGFAVGAIAAGVAGLTAMAKNALSTAAALQDVAENTGIAATELQKLAFAAEQSGGNAESLLSSIRKFNVEIGEARTKGGDLAKILRDNGVSLEQDNLAVWRQVVDLIANAKDETEAAYLAQLAMGRGAADNLNLFRQGSAAISHLGQMAQEAGAIVDDELVKKADEFVDAWNKSITTLQAGISSWLITMAAALQKFDDYYKSTAFGQLATRNAGPGAFGEAAAMGGVGDAAKLLAKPRAPTVINLTKPGKDLDEIPLKVEEVNVKLEKTKTLTETIAGGFDNIGSTLLGVARGAETLDKALQRTLDRILDTLADQAFQTLISAIISGLGPKTLGGTTFASGAQARQALSFGGPRQSGGPVTAGKSYLVGEHGPELMMPNRSGYVVPSGRGGGGSNMNVQIVTPPGMQAQTRTQTNGNGQSLQVTFRQMLAQELPGVMKPMLRDQYAMTPATRRRF